MAKRKSKASKDERPDGQSPDPYLRAFLRQAVAIIAAERGINDVSYAKLQVIAQRLGLSDESFQSAIEKLKQPDSALGLSRYENKFVEMLSKQFEKIRGDVLSVRNEDRVIKVAEERYQIDAVRAHQLIQKTAEQYDIATISHSDAQQFALHLIDEAVAAHTWLRKNDQQRLYQTCLKWGMSETDVDIAVRSRLSRNRSKRRTRLLLQGMYLFIGLMIAVAITLAVTRVDWQELVGQFAELPGEIPAPAVASDRVLPGWWDGELRGQADRIRLQNPSMAPLLDRLANLDTKSRRESLQELIDQLLEVYEWNESLSQFIVRLYYLDPDDREVSPVIERTQELMSISRADKVASPSHIRRSLNALHLLGTLIFTDCGAIAASGRRAAIDELVEESLGFKDPPATKDEFMRLGELRLTVSQWNHAIRFGRFQPQPVAAMLPELEKRSRSAADDGVNELRTIVVRAILEVQPWQWKSLTRSIETAIANADSAKTVAWIDLLLTNGDSEFADFLRQRIAVQLKLNPENRSRESIIRELKAVRVNFLTRRIKPALEAGRQIDVRIGSLGRRLNTTGIDGFEPEIRVLNEYELPPLIADSTAINNLAFAWIRAAESADGFSALDLMLERESPATTSFPSRPQPEKRSPATSSDKRKFDESLDRLFSSQPHQVTARISVLQSLAGLAEKFDDIDYVTAEKLAKYLFGAFEDREALAVERALPDFSHWAQLPLAIADRLDNSDVNLDTVLSHLNRLGMQGLNTERGGNWRASLRFEILQAVAGQIADEEQTGNNRDGWNQLQQMLRSLYLERSEIIGATRVNQRDRSLSNLLTWGIENCIRETQDLRNERWLRMLEWIRLSNDAEISNLVLANLLLGEIWNRRIPDSNGSKLRSRKFAAELQSDSLNNGQRLLASEMLLMDVLSEYRRRWIERESQ